MELIELTEFLIKFYLRPLDSTEFVYFLSILATAVESYKMSKLFY